MKKLFFVMALLCVSSFAATPAVQCNPNNPNDPNAPCPETGYESCDIVDDGAGPEKRCFTTGYICRIGMNPARDGGADAMFFHLGTTPTCEPENYFLTGDSDMKTCLFYRHRDANNNLQTDIYDSPSTKFFLNNDNYAGPLAMTVTGSLALSAYNHSDKVQIIYTATGRKYLDTRPNSPTYNQECLEEHSGIRVLAIDVIKK